MTTLIVVNGGDAPGINTLIARYLSLASGEIILGAVGGFSGLLSGKIRELSLDDVGPVAGRGGTILASTREAALTADGAQARLTAVLTQHNVDHILLFGGNGTLKHIPPLLREWNIPVIGIPTTIDNDVPGTDRTLGFDSACNFAYQSIEGVLATARALPGRIFMVETLGGDTGYIALDVAAGSGAHAVLVPEYDYNNAWLSERIKQSIQRDGHALIVLSEGVPNIPELPELIPRLTGIRLRYTRLGHGQRGGVVSHIDRRLALDMACTAFDAFQQGITFGTVIVRGNRVLLYEDGLSHFELSPPDRQRYEFINGLP